MTRSDLKRRQKKRRRRTSHHRIGGPPREFIIVGVDSNSTRESFVAYNGYAIAGEIFFAKSYALRCSVLRWPDRAEAERVVAHLTDVQRYYGVWPTYRLLVSELGKSPEGKPLALDLPSSQRSVPS